MDTERDHWSKGRRLVAADRLTLPTAIPFRRSESDPAAAPRDQNARGRERRGAAMFVGLILAGLAVGWLIGVLLTGPVGAPLVGPQSPGGGASGERRVEP